MRKEGKLYVANKHNLSLFTDIDRETNNIFDGLTFGQSSLMDTNPTKVTYNQYLKKYYDPMLGKHSFTNWGQNIAKNSYFNQVQSSYQDFTKKLNDKNYLSSLGKKSTVGLTTTDPKEFFGSTQETSSDNSSNGSGVGYQLAGTAIDTIGNYVNNTKYGPKKTAVGSALKSAAPALMAASPIAGLAVMAGGVILDGGLGYTLNEEGIKDIKEGNAAMRAASNALSQSTSTNDFINKWGNIDLGYDFNKDYIGEDGWWTNNVANEFSDLKKGRKAARTYVAHAGATGAQNINKTQNNATKAAFISAYGGPLFLDNSNMGGVIDYDLATDYLLTKKKNTDKTSNMTNMFMGSPSTMFAIGGDLQTNSADFSTGLTHIDAGGSHSENPNDGVQMGVDSQNVPNLVEEGETVYDDYVFSNRIMADSTTKELFKLPKKKDITFADISKKLEKEISERPADPISEAGFKSMMLKLEEQQERQKQEMEAERARAAFEALSPEEQAAVMQQKAEQEAMAQQAAQEQAIAQQQTAQPSPEEMQMMQQQAVQADGSQAMIGQEPQMNACGGKINKFDKGGEIKKKIYELLGIDTDEKFQEWASKHGNREFIGRMKDVNWEKALEDMELMEAVAGDNKALRDALSKGYDFGVSNYINAPNGTYQWDKFWGPVNEYSKQNGSSDNKYRIDSKTLTKKQVKDLENSEEYKVFTDYILNDATDEERAKYFQWIDDNTGRKNKYLKDGKLVKGWQDAYKAARNDGLYGIQHYTPTLADAARKAEAQNLLWNSQTNEWNVIQGNVNPAYQKSGSYSWTSPDTDYTYNYYTDPSAVVVAPEGANTPKEKAKAASPAQSIVPDLKKETMFGMFGPAVNLGLMSLGVGRPDTSGMDRALASAARSYHTATNKYLGNYLKYQPMDIWFQQAKMDANARATDRAIMNSGANQGSKAAALLASGYNNQIADGELYRQALEYNDKKRQDVAAFNRGTDQFNAQAFNDLSKFNAQQLNRGEEFNAQMQMDAAKQKMYSDAQWYNSLYGNINGIFDRINQWEKWKRDHNTVAKMYANGLAGVVTPETPVAQGYVTYGAKGGKLKKNKKRGLTF